MGPILEARNVTKSFPGVKALDAVSLTLRAGEVHALVGENGAGKSTLISILTGAQKPDKGQLSVNGQPVVLNSPEVARHCGVGAIFQELSIQPWLDVTANIVLGNEPVKAGIGLMLDGPAADKIAQNYLDKLGATEIQLRTLASQLSTGQKQLVEIARALALDTPVIIMDEPTSSLPSRDAQHVLEVIGQLRSEGKAILFVSHRLDEVMDIADTITVLRSGKIVLTAPKDQVTPNIMIEAMIGRPIDNLFPAREDSPKVRANLLRVKSLTRGKSFRDVTFDLHGGEVLGFYGLIGAGRTELMRALSGADHFDRGEIELEGEAIRPTSPRSAIKSGIVYLPEDRKMQGLILQMSGRENIVLPILRRMSPFGIIRRSSIKELTSKFALQTNVRGSLDNPVSNLSGGNQQKIVIAKGLATDAKVLIFDEPTRGIDVGSKYEIYVLIQQLARRGVGIILVSSELPEIMNLADRAIVMSGGRVSETFNRDAFEERTLLSAAFAAFRTQQ